MNVMSINGEKWIVSLSDGSTLEEETLCDEPRRISPWSKLVEEILPSREVHISQLRVQVLGKTYTCPSRSDRSKFPSSIKPTGYMCMRRIGFNALKPSEVLMNCIGMEVSFPNGMRITTWVDVYTGDSWQQVM